MLEFWKNTSSVAKWSLFFGLTSIVALGIVLYVWASSAQYAVLYSDLQEQEAAQITKALTDGKFDYRLQQGGKTILVNDQQLNEIRLRLVESHLPLSGGQGFELFDNVEYGMTEFVQNINYQRAMQGELARTISAMPEVKSARVHLVFPKESLFQKNKHKRTAAVTLSLVPGRTLSQEQINGIQHLVSSSVEAMDVNDVLVFDENGMALSSVEDANQLGMSHNFQFKKQVEEYLSYKARKVIEGILGQPVGYVYVDADINFDEVNITQELYKPEKATGRGIVVKSKVITSYRENSADNSESKNAAKQETTEHEYRISKSIEQIVQSKGGLKRISVSVTLPEGIRMEMMEAIKNLVMSAVGFNEDRGDHITIHSLAVPNALEDESIEPASADDGLLKPLDIKESLEKSAPVTAEEGKSLLLGTAILMLVLLGAVLFLRYQQQRQVEPVALSPQERERLLADIKSWMNS